MLIANLLENGERNQTALHTSNGPISYAELTALVEDLATSLRKFGLRKGDRIAMALPNGLETVACFLAASSVGTAAPLNPGYTQDEFKFYLEDTGARALIVPRDRI